MRELMFASGGRCAMTGCGLPLVSPTGGWIGTVAHIVGAEKNGPRGAGPVSAEERRAFANLLLMCASHGRDVDAPDTGEKNFTIAKLQQIKAAHETKIADAVLRAINQELTGLRTANDVLDTSLRSANAASTGEGLAESMEFDDDVSIQGLLAALEEARARLQRLSQPALDILSQLLELWEMHCRDDKTLVPDFGESSGRSPRVSISIVENRLTRGSMQSFTSATDELVAQGLLSMDVDEYEQVYALKDPWGMFLNSFWINVAWFLYSGHGVEIHFWVKTLDFTIFDRLAPEDRDVWWR